MNYSTRSTQLLQFKNSVYKYQKQSKGFLHQSKKATLIFFLSIPICQNQTIYIICSTKVETLIKSSWNKMLLCLRHKHHVIANQIKWGFFLLMLYIYILTIVKQTSICWCVSLIELLPFSFFLSNNWCLCVNSHVIVMMWHHLLKAIVGAYC
jgi:hypothetical protein